MKLTGKTRYRLGWRGRVIVQVEFWRIGARGVGYESAWKDADFRSVLDIAEGNVQSDRPSFGPPPPKGGE
jgi:hypothetical protein